MRIAHVRLIRWAVMFPAVQKSKGSTLRTGAAANHRLFSTELPQNVKYKVTCERMNASSKPQAAGMKISAKTEYACIAMLELASRFGSGEPVRIRKIAERHDVPPRFLVQILLQLKGAGLVASTRGAAGGYHLVRAPDEVSLGEVMEVIEGAPRNGGQSSASPDSPAVKVLMNAWQDVNRVQRKMLREISFSELLERARAQDEQMYYI